MAAKKISLFSLVLLIVAAIASIRNFPSAALFGPSLIFFFIFSAILFLIPIALVSAELSAAYPEEGGVYHWVRHAFGEKWAMAAIWLQWINTMIWYPTMLSFIGGTAAYLIDPALAQNKIYLVGSILVIIWLLTLLSLFGIRVSAKVNDICATIGTVFPMILLISLGVIWMFSHQPLQIKINASTLFPSLTQGTSWVSLIAIMASFLGMELSGVHVSDIRNPAEEFSARCFMCQRLYFVCHAFGVDLDCICGARKRDSAGLRCDAGLFDFFQGIRPRMVYSSADHPHCDWNRWRDHQLADFARQGAFACGRVWFFAKIFYSKESF